jgi:hypothetical protein
MPKIEQFLKTHKFTKNVEIMCKTLCKTPCKYQVKLCEKLTPLSKSCVNPLLSHAFPTILPPTFSQPSAPIVQLFYPLFHQAYYYNYK